MCRPVYNSAIPAAILISANRVRRGLFPYIVSLCFLASHMIALPAAAVDWSVPEQELARKIVTVTGPGVIALSIENRSSLRQREGEIIQNGLRTALSNLGIRIVKSEQAAATVNITLSENSTAYVWVAQIHQSAGEDAVVMVSSPRTESSTVARESVPLALRKTILYMQADSILDVAVLEENPAPAHIAVLDPEKISFYRWQAGKWQPEQIMNISHARPWPRDMRGKLVVDRDHLLQAYLPGVVCSTAASSPVALNCRESDDPWPLVPASFNVPNSFSAPTSPAPAGIPPLKAFYASTRDFFTGVLTLPIGKFSSVPKFYSLAAIPRERYILWLLTATNGQLHVIDGVSDQSRTLAWGSDIASLKTQCGAGWQVLATTATDRTDSLRAYEIPDRDPVPVSAAIDFSGPITALWTEGKGDMAIAVARNEETGNYEAFRIELACGQ